MAKDRLVAFFSEKLPCSLDPHNEAACTVLGLRGGLESRRQKLHASGAGSTICSGRKAGENKSRGGDKAERENSIERWEKIGGNERKKVEGSSAIV